MKRKIMLPQDVLAQNSGEVGGLASGSQRYHSEIPKDEIVSSNRGAKTVRYHQSPSSEDRQGNSSKERIDEKTHKT